MSGEYQVHLQAGLTVFALIFDENRTKVWDGAAFTAISSIADAAWAAGAVACVEQLTSDNTGTGLYVGDRPAAISDRAIYLVEFYNGTPTPGATNYAIQFDDLTGYGTATTATCLADDLKTEVGDFLSLGRSGWAAADESRIDSIVLAGRRQFYWPPPLPGQATAHRWSFMSPVTTLATVVDQSDYDLSADFGGLVTGTLHYAAADDVWHPIREVSIGQILNARQSDPSSGSPQCAATFPQTSDGTAAQTWKLGFDRPADAIYTVTYQYHAVPSSPGAAYNLGSSVHYDTILAACLAVAEARYRPSEQAQQAHWLERLAASISHDRRLSPRFLGYYGDKTDDVSVRKRHDYVTFGGIQYP